MKHKLQNPIFLVSVFILLLNDFYLKAEYHNFLTGKLSDFAGLFAFPFFFSCLFPNRKMFIHIMTAVLFVFWKSSYCQVFIDGINGFGIPVARVVDFTDNMALISVLFSYYIFEKYAISKPLKPLIGYSIMLVAVFAFLASHVRHLQPYTYTDVNKEYKFPFSKDELIIRYNAVQEKNVKQAKDDKYVSDVLIYDAYSREYRWKKDKSVFARTFDPEKSKNADTIWVNDYSRIDALYYITGDSGSSKLVLVNKYANRYTTSRKAAKDTVIIAYSTLDSLASENIQMYSLERMIIDIQNIY